MMSARLDEYTPMHAPQLMRRVQPHRALLDTSAITFATIKTETTHHSFVVLYGLGNQFKGGVHPSTIDENI
eukprot:2107483-Amphidinium_carterae.1